MCYTHKPEVTVFYEPETHTVCSVVRDPNSYKVAVVDSVSWRSHEFALLALIQSVHVGTVFFGGLDSSKLLILQSQTKPHRLCG